MNFAVSPASYFGNRRIGFFAEGSLGHESRIVSSLQLFFVWLKGCDSFRQVGIHPLLLASVL